MTSRKSLSKPERRFQKAVYAINHHGATRRVAAIIARLPLSTFQRQLMNMNKPKTLRTCLKAEEEKVIVDLINHYSSKGFPLNRQDVADSVQLLVESLPEERRQKLPFIGNRPGKKFLANFLKRHASSISFRRCSKEQDQCWRTCNADTLTTHFLAIAKIIEDNDINDYRIANLDETGISLNKDCLQSDRRKHYVARSRRPQQRTPEFKNIDHVTLMPVVFASGCLGPCLTAVKGKTLRYRVLSGNGGERVETIADCLPSGGLIATRADVAGVDSINFYEWAKEFADYCKPLTAQGRHVLLCYDAYRSHMTLRVLHLLHQNRIIVYALPAHTSGMTQPLDVGVFGPFKEHIRNLVEELASPDSAIVCDAFDFLKLMRSAYETAFTRANIQGAFGKAGIHPLRWFNLINSPRPKSLSDPNTMISVTDIATMIEEKRAQQRSNIGLQSLIVRGGYLDTTAGLCLTSKEALDKAADLNAAQVAKRAEQQRKEAEKAAKESIIYEQVKTRRLRANAAALQYRVATYGDRNVEPRSMAVRKQIAKRRVAARRALIASQTSGHVSSMLSM